MKKLLTINQRRKRKDRKDVRTRANVIASRDGWNCAYCLKGVRKDYQVDHILPIARFPQFGYKIHSLRNLVLSCPQCNQEKGDRMPFLEWQPPSTKNQRQIARMMWYFKHGR